MAWAADKFPRASFDGIEFPWIEIEIKGGLREYEHVYLHRPGGEIESLGRKLYEFRFSCPFHEVSVAYPNLYPARLFELIRRLETEESGTLVVPNYGRFRVKGLDWSRRLAARIKTGERVELVFKEDQQIQLVTEQQAALAFASIPTKSALVFALYEQKIADFTSRVPTDAEGTRILGDLDTARYALQDAILKVQEVRGIADAANAVGSSYRDRIRAVAQTCEALVNNPLLQLEEAYPLVESIHDLWDAAVQSGEAAASRSRPVGIYITQRIMTIGEVAIALYDDVSRAQEILSINNFARADRIPRETRVNHYIAVGMT